MLGLTTQIFLAKSYPSSQTRLPLLGTFPGLYSLGENNYFFIWPTAVLCHVAQSCRSQTDQAWNPSSSLLSHVTLGKSFHLFEHNLHQLSVGMVILPTPRVSWGLDENISKAPSIPLACNKPELDFSRHQPFVSQCHDFFYHNLPPVTVTTITVFAWYFSFTWILTLSPAFFHLSLSKQHHRGNLL